MTQETSSVLDALGISADDLEWQQLALCQGQDTERWYTKYESSARVAKLTDEICMSCPVQRACLQAGIENGEYGCWGGVFLTAGKMDQGKNAHKTQEVWEDIRDGLNAPDQ